MSLTQTESTIVKEITINAPAARVYAALTDPEQLPQWWGEEGKYHVDKMEVDLRVGGRWRTSGKSADGDTFAVEGVYLAIDPPHLLEMTWKHDWTENPEETVVRYELTETNGKTHLHVTHSGFSNVESRDGHDAGWTQVLSWLSDYVTKER